MIIGEPRVQPECHADTLLLQMILKTTVTHVPSNGNIANIFTSNVHDHKNLICITDNDSAKPEIFDKLDQEKIYPYGSNPNLILKRKTGTNLYLIIISPGLERWILKCCDDINFDKTKYSFLKNLSSLQDALKKHDVEKNIEVKNFFNSLIVRKNPPPLITKLKSWIDKKLQ